MMWCLWGDEMDNLTKDQRRKNMQHIRSKDTSIEVRLRKALWRKGYRYRKNCKDIPGKPPILTILALSKRLSDYLKNK